MRGRGRELVRGEREGASEGRGWVGGGAGENWLLGR